MWLALASFALQLGFVHMYIGSYMRRYATTSLVFAMTSWIAIDNAARFGIIVCVPQRIRFCMRGMTIRVCLRRVTVATAVEGPHVVSAFAGRAAVSFR